MEVTTIPARKRSELGKRQIGRVRADGHVPAVVYGRGQAPEHIRISSADLARELRNRNRVFELDVEGNREPVYLQSLQSDTLTDEPLHVDFLRIDMGKPIPTDVPLVFLGVPAGASRGGTLVRDMAKLSVLAMPSSIPHEIEVKVAQLDLLEAVRAKDVSLPEGVTLAVADDAIVCHVSE